MCQIKHTGAHFAANTAVLQYCELRIVRNINLESHLQMWDFQVQVSKFVDKKLSRDLLAMSSGAVQEREYILAPCIGGNCINRTPTPLPPAWSPMQSATGQCGTVTIGWLRFQHVWRSCLWLHCTCSCNGTRCINEYVVISALSAASLLICFAVLMLSSLA